MPVSPALRRLRQDNQKFKVIADIENWRLAWSIQGSVSKTKREKAPAMKA